jgi:hypothetical protein
MKFRLLAVLALLCVVATGKMLRADESFEEEKDGMVYRVTKRVRPKTVYEAVSDSHEQTVYTQKLQTEIKEAPRSYWTPVTQYQWTPVWERTWNPLQPPYVAYRMVPVTKWELKNDTVQYGYTSQKVEPEKRTFTTQHWEPHTVNDEYSERVCLGPAKNRSAENVARRNPPDAYAPRVDDANSSSSSNDIRTKWGSDR